MTQRGPATVARAKRLCNSCLRILPDAKKGVAAGRVCPIFTNFRPCVAKPLHRLGSRTRQIGRVRTRPDAKKGVAAGRVRPSVRFPPRRWRNLRRRDQLHKSTSPPGRVRTRPQLHKVHNRRGKLPRGVCLCTQNVHKVHKVHSRRWRN